MRPLSFFLNAKMSLDKIIHNQLRKGKHPFLDIMVPLRYALCRSLHTIIHYTYIDIHITYHPLKRYVHDPLSTIPSGTQTWPAWK